MSYTEIPTDLQAIVDRHLGITKPKPVGPCMYPEGCYPEPADCEYHKTGALTKCAEIQLEAKLKFLAEQAEKIKAEKYDS